ncbi:MAG: GTP 3',8-cyclase MoaA [Clostridia bacterium]|nr:GTP 3',8-cyclase MoaA [Clostridia bacterium]
MIDSYGREINYLRVSVTKRCNLNCTYCGAQNEKENNELTADEIEKTVRAFALCGIDKVRLTGGEPLVRKDICYIAERISRIDGIKKLALTTNGIRLKECAGELKKAGVRAVNISLDTTDRERFKSITGYDGLNKVYDGIDECERVGLSPIRINAVLIRGQNDSDAESLINIARERKIDVRFIELMPFSDEGDNDELVIKSDEILQKFPFLKPAAQKGTAFEKSVARYYESEGFKGRIGFITPISDKFCSECNRIRLLSDGKVKVCLGSDEVIDLKPYLCDEKLLEEKVRDAILSKPMEHKFSCGYGASHGLNKIGG